MAIMNEQILREQIIELTKLLELKDARIKELEVLMTMPFSLVPTVSSNTVIITDANQTQNSCDCYKKQGVTNDGL
jgi:hypothetical protein